MSANELPHHGIFRTEAVDSAEADSCARLGQLALPGRNVVETPNFFSLTSRGVVPHLTSDVILEHTQFGGVHMALEDFIEKAISGTPPIMKCPPRKSTPLHTFTALPAALVTILAPRRSPAVAAPTGNTDRSISLFTSVGFQSLTNSEWIRYARTLKPDIVIGLADISYGTLPGTKRVEKMGDRTSVWLDSLLAGLEEEEKSTFSPPAIFAPVLAIDFHSQSEYLNRIADELADSISGLAFYSSSLLPDIPATTHLSLLPRLSLDEPPSPHHILRQISLGMDVFTIPFINSATDAGLALTFQFPYPPAGSEASSHEGTKPLAIDLSSQSYAASLAPLLPACTCYACTSHHRAYVQHLLAAKEMLGWVLLQIHNHATLLSFFASIRKSIRVGRFEHGRELFEREYESDLPDGTGQRPRARGYHFKAEGPGEKKRNKPAWGALGNGMTNGSENENGGDIKDKVMLSVDESADLENKGHTEIEDS